MGKSQQSFNKKEREKKRLKKREEKQKRKEERKANSDGGGLDNMIAYVDEYGNITDTPPDPAQKEEIAAEDIEIGIPKKGEENIDPIKKGKVDFFNDEKGFGFIRENSTQEKYFFHVSNIEEEVLENDPVTFELEKGPKGLNAVRVKKG